MGSSYQFYIFNDKERSRWFEIRILLSWLAGDCRIAYLLYSHRHRSSPAPASCQLKFIAIPHKFVETPFYLLLLYCTPFIFNVGFNEGSEKGGPRIQTIYGIRQQKWISWSHNSRRKSAPKSWRSCWPPAPHAPLIQYMFSESFTSVGRLPLFLFYFILFRLGITQSPFSSVAKMDEWMNEWVCGARQVRSLEIALLLFSKDLSRPRGSAKVRVYSS